MNRWMMSAAGLMLLSGVAHATDADAGKLEFFEKKVRPILVGHCYGCHSAETKPAGGLRVDDRNGLLAGGNGGPSVVPGKPEESPLIRRVSPTAPKRMPAEGEPLSGEQVAILKQWIRDGAAWPPVAVPASFGKQKAIYAQLRTEHWAFQPVRTHELPAVLDRAWPGNPVDHWILAKLESEQLAPVSDADRLTLIRRVTVDLTGLPPTPAEVERFLADDHPDAYPRLVERLLASAAFGEQWGRHWLDVARYGESTGPSRNIPYPHAWRYRDYVIDALNRDLPFDRFIQEQVAGDLLEAATDTERDRQKVATGFLALGVKDVNQRFKVRFEMDNVDEQIDAVTRSTLALTVSCARCHDHKFDPVPQSDYYALAGIFTSTDHAAGVRNLMGGGGLAYYAPEMLVRLSQSLPPPPPEQVARLQAELAEAKQAWDAIRGTPEGLKPAADGQPTQRPFRLKYERLQGEYNALTDPALRALTAHGVRDSRTVGDTQLRVRGEAEKLGPTVPRGFLTAFALPQTPAIGAQQSGRKELAAWITSPHNPLTARVYANRIWSHLFGRGLVSTVDNFGVTGATPTHPELLDSLADYLVRNQWSTKQLVRLLVLSRTYRLDSTATDLHRRKDPANTLLWRHSPRRLTADEFRDAVLAGTGGLGVSRPQGSPVRDLKMIEMLDNGPEARALHDAADRTAQRSVYLPLVRGVVPHALQAFDPVEQTLVTGQRDQTTVPAQALFLLNSPFIRQYALRLAERVLQAPQGDRERIEGIYQQLLGRRPRSEEVSRLLSFLQEYEAAARSQWQQPPRPAAKPLPKAAQPRKAVEPIDPDQVDQSGEPVREVIIQAKDPRTAAWMALVQSVIASAEFRYIP